MEKLKQINKGTISYRLALTQIAYFIVIAIIDISGNYTLYYSNTYALWEFRVRIVAAIIGLLLGVVSLFQKESNKVRPILGIVVSAFILRAPLVVILKILIMFLNN
ncbi:hypothetical protein [Clostridium sp. YIM B02555]|uniref:hypothetical protein n=1 Tax=Clostridium sp. YIM B02555 TaxID=2911968 RepID=UPI001EEEEADE|nr:hypothetical protein [Clostridium sp. YIM B02555]